MAIDSVGYGPNGTTAKVTAVQFAAMQRGFGAPYYVDGKGDWLVTAVAGQDRTVTIAPGSGGGYGIRDVVSGTTPTVQLDNVAAGSVVYSLVGMQRDWTAGTTTLVKITGNSSQVVPSSRNATPGVIDVQPLALVQVTGGQSLPTVVADLRVWPGKVATVNDARALVSAQYGDEAVVAGVRMRYITDASGNPVWVPTYRKGSVRNQQISSSGNGVGPMIVSHGLGVVPSQVIISQVRSPFSQLFKLELDSPSPYTSQSWDAFNFTVRAFRYDGASLANTTASFDWVAYS